MESEFDDLFWCDLDDFDFNFNFNNYYYNDVNNNLTSSPAKRLKTNSGQASTSNRSYNTLNPNLACPISSLTPFSFRWIIKGRVVSKSNVHSWNNAKGKGVLFSFDIKDSSDTMRFTAFGKECVKFYDQVQIDHVYLIARGRVKQANKKYTNSNYEISLTEHSVIELYEDDQDCPSITYNFVDFEEISHYVNSNSFVDIVGVVVEIDELSTYVRRKDSVQGMKRNIQLVDQTRNQIVCTLWENYGKDFNGKLGDVIVIKNVNVSDFHNVSLSTLSNSTVQMNPEMTIVDQLRTWFNGQKNLTTRKLTNVSTSSPTEWSTLSIITLENVKRLNQPSILVKAVIINLGRANMYKACRTCMKKLNDLNGLLRCERCSVDRNQFDWKLMLQLCLSDHTSSTWATAFSDLCAKLLDLRDFSHLGAMYEQNYGEFLDQLSHLNFKTFLFKLKCKVEVFNGEEKVRVVVDHIAEQKNLIDYGRRLLEEIRNN